VHALCSILVELVLCENVGVFLLAARSCKLQSVELRCVSVVEVERSGYACAGRDVSALSAFLQVPRRHTLLICVKSSLPVVASAMASAVGACFRLCICQMES